MSSPRPSYRPTPPPDAGEQWVDPATGLSWDRGADQWFDPSTGRWTVYAEPQDQPPAWPPPQEYAASQQQYGPPPQPNGPPPRARSGVSGTVLVLVGGGVAAVIAAVVVLALVFTAGDGDTTPAAGGRATTGPGSSAPDTDSNTGSNTGSNTASSSPSPSDTGTPTDIPTEVPNLAGLSLALPNSDAGDPEEWPGQIPTPAPLAKASDPVYLYGCDGQPQNYDGGCATASATWLGNYATAAVYANYADILTRSGLTADDRNDDGSVPQAQFHGGNFDVLVALDKRTATASLEVTIVFYAPAYNPYD